MRKHLLSTLEYTEVRKFIIIFYVVGFLGFLIPYTRTLFKAITPLALVLCVVLLGIFHAEYKRKDIFVFLSICVVGFLAELTGVHTGLLFGSYSYGPTLGWQLYETPLVIGVNWLFLVYATTSLTDRFLGKWMSLFLAPALMLVYDSVLEQVAGTMDMWYWQAGVIPWKNFIDWYLIAFLFVGLLKVFKVKVQNRLAPVLLCAQFGFFLLLYFIM